MLVLAVRARQLVFAALLSQLEYRPSKMSGPRGTVTAPIIFQSAMNLALCVHRKTRCSHPQAWIGCVRKFRRNVCQHHFCAICGDSAQEVASNTQTQFAPAFLTITIRDLSARLYTRLAPPRHPREQNPRGGFRLRALAAFWRVLLKIICVCRRSEADSATRRETMLPGRKLSAASL